MSMVALTHCSNVTGAVTDVGRLTAAARVIGVKVMLDGAQRAPHGPIDVQQLDVDFYAFSGHTTDQPVSVCSGAAASCLTQCHLS